ncbi:hypothetical protein Salat_0638500 [Sesamum alatum]|uniref:Uncharacterized protein n=1 Tax=Sesamum alatum TaxID=300844 RepID=A0AAE1YR63_9LAMI|nr:hypothetical protein Salat_0638500 [Sesamum alatum]
MQDIPEVDVGSIQPTAENEKQLMMDNDAIFEANNWETIFQIVDNVVDEIRSQQPVVEGAEGDAVRGGEGDTVKGGEGEGGEAMRGGEGEMTDAVRCGVGNREDEVVENDEFSDSIEFEDNDVDLEDDDAKKRFEVGSHPPTQEIQSQDANVIEEQVLQLGSWVLYVKLGI